MHLVLNTFGTQLLVEDGQFLVITADKRQLLPPAAVRTITIGKGIRLSSNALMLAIAHEVDVLLVEKAGNNLGRIWSAKYGSIATIRKNQAIFGASPEAVLWVTSLLSFKLQNQLSILYALGGFEVAAVRVAERKILAAAERLKAIDGYSITEVAGKIRAAEGQAALAYFEAISALLPQPYQFGGRSRQPAKDAFNCLLNYAYGILYGRVELALIKAGLDPYMGVFHRDEYNRPSLVYDVIERYRVWADHVVTHLCVQQAIAEDFFSISPNDGGYWLEGLGKRVLIQSMNDYMDEVVPINQVPRSRLTHIDLDAQALATMMKQIGR
jgi:CRISPR-associated protein Cas1